MKRWPWNKTYFWVSSPFFRLLLPLIVGILFYTNSFYTVKAEYLPVYIGILLPLFCFFSLLQARNKFISISVLILLNIILFLSGIVLCYNNDIRNNKDWFGNNIKQNTLAIIKGEPIEKEKSWKLTVSIINSLDHNTVKIATGKAFVYLFKGRLPMLLHAGDTLLLPANWQLLKNSGNPYEFDYKNYCRLNNVFYQQSTSIDNIRLYARVDTKAASLIDKSHDWCMLQLEKHISDSATKGLIQAMLIGDEINLDEQMRQAWSQTGIIHIIAISGGNVAILFMVVSFLLWWIKDAKHFWIKYAIALPLVWFYILMAGAPPSAVRAAIMFSLLAFSYLLQKPGNSLNQLFATAFLLLLANPNWLFSTGFQLSFTAVLSLILFYKYIYKWFNAKKKFLQIIWSCIAASIAAEILVAPLVVFYFHTFPVFFIVTNVIAYFFMNIVLIAGMLIIALSGFTVLADYIGIIATFITSIFNKIIFYLQNCSPVSFHWLVLNNFEIIILFCIVICLAQFFIKKQKTALLYSLGLGCILLLSFCKNEYIVLQQDKFIVFNTTKNSRVERITGKHYVLIAYDTPTLKKSETITMPLHTYLQAWHKEQIKPEELYFINGKSVLILNKESIYRHKFPVDYVLINYKGKIEPELIDKTFHPAKIIIGTNYSEFVQEKWIEKSHQNKIPIYTIAKEGAFILE